MKKYKYEIVIKEIYLSYLLKELKAWGVDPDLYRVSGNSLFTSNNNVVDVVTESFIKYPEFYEIKKNI